MKLRFYVSESRTQNRESLIAEIDKLNASDPENPITHVINAAGVTGSNTKNHLYFLISFIFQGAPMLIGVRTIKLKPSGPTLLVA